MNIYKSDNLHNNNMYTYGIQSEEVSISFHAFQFAFGYAFHLHIK